mgnify:FL=1
MPCSNSELTKSIEKDWYAQKANIRRKYISWVDFCPDYLKSPYKKYIGYFRQFADKAPRILELCCGMGEFSFDIERLSNGDVFCLDISKESIDICNHHLKELGRRNLRFETADVESIELPEHEFDVICMSGSLSYLNLDVFLANIKKWLKPDGCLIVVDTYGYSPFFNLKRKLNYLFGKTTKQTVLGIPKKETIDAIKNCFEYSEINFYGVFAFIGPFLRYVVGDKMTTKIVDFLDKTFPNLSKYAFKFVFKGDIIKND